MLDNLRGMAVFASVVQNGSFSGASKELGITTSAVSQQIRALELDLGVVLLHRSTRKLSLTEAGESLYESAKSMVRAAEEGKDNVSQFRDGLLGNLRIATTPDLARLHIMPALSEWLSKHADLSLRIVTSETPIDMIGECVDLSINFGRADDKHGVPLLQTEQVLLASEGFLMAHRIDAPEDLVGLNFILHDECDGVLNFSKDNQSHTINIKGRITSNDTALSVLLAKQGYGIIKINQLTAQDAIRHQGLVQVLPSYQLPTLTLYAKTLAKEQQPAKVSRCLEVLTGYFGAMNK